ncbi:hypothetical protein TTHERM_01149280 (macronuclear) [Tetrahymena thermophila SB210]|uniref:Zinc finger protein n=1 Tax=Tetrahymena thermophila (strain SB210) TaxID=312017 RepID=Q23ZB4_TETTS|nr:hypothetical protein TTHERM_01149280 [Tetrahymena thermophila SB210]EAS01857.1 hypothetical protein TTHERM_01149280 [Tetrahymena thermophila SB210]|eukprot:XP_001022102.1 hypothetical protein TTHERM_01149280 [Tetrahymena thermophila SB210]
MDVFVCAQSCQNGETQDQNQQCIQCNIVGCIEYNCQSQVGFAKIPYNASDCYQSCPSTYYSNFDQKVCQKTIQCPSTENSSNYQLPQRVLQVEQFQTNHYLVRANQCTFALVDSDWKIVSVQILQKMYDYEQQYMLKGEEIQQQSFMVGSKAGCIAGNKLTVFDFQTFQLYDKINNTQLKVYYI